MLPQFALPELLEIQEAAGTLIFWLRSRSGAGRAHPKSGPRNSIPQLGVSRPAKQAEGRQNSSLHKPLQPRNSPSASAKGRKPSSQKIQTTGRQAVPAIFKALRNFLEARRPELKNFRATADLLQKLPFTANRTANFSKLGSRRRKRSSPPRAHSLYWFTENSEMVVEIFRFEASVCRSA